MSVRGALPPLPHLPLRSPARRQCINVHVCPFSFVHVRWCEHTHAQVRACVSAGADAYVSHSVRTHTHSLSCGHANTHEAMPNSPFPPCASYALHTRTFPSLCKEEGRRICVCVVGSASPYALHTRTFPSLCKEEGRRFCVCGWVSLTVCASHAHIPFLVQRRG